MSQSECVIILVLIACLFITCNSFVLKNNGTNVARRPSKEANLQFSCYDFGEQPVMELMPTGFSCNEYFHCRLTDNVAAGPKPQLSSCQHDWLVYDFRTCRCLEPDVGECYNDDIDEHRADRYKCTTPYIGPQKPEH